MSYIYGASSHFIVHCSLFLLDALQVYLEIKPE